MLGNRLCATLWIALLFVLSLVLAPRVLLAGNPNWPGVPGGPDELPDDPGYDPYRAHVPGADPVWSGQWELWDDPPATTPTLQSGMRLEEAWKYTIGGDRNPDGHAAGVLLAILDSGVNSYQEADLVNQFWTNTGEIPNNGLDDDGNGYVDDYHGYDFHKNVRDALDELYFGHGTGCSEDAAAQANNGIGGAGVCPNCQVMIVRIGDSFVVDADRFAMGVIYAVDNGAKVISSSTGSINNTRFAQAAIDYAYSHGVTVFLSAADEDSYHHNFPSALNHGIFCKAIIPDATFFEDSYVYPPRTYFAHAACTNIGGRNELAASSRGCSSGATPRSAGIGALCIAMAEAQSIPPLTPNEVKQILTMAAEDILDDSATTFVECGKRLEKNSITVACQKGWDQHFGYGRPDAERAVRWVAADTIPPEADIEAPLWFEVLDPVRTPIVDITGYVNARRAPSNSYQYWIEYAPGVEPEDCDFLPIASGSDVGPRQGVLAHWDISGIPYTNPPRTHDDYTITLRLRVTDLDRGFRGECRKTVAVQHDPDLLEAFPMKMEGSGESSPTLIDIDGDRKDEIVLATANGEIKALNEDGSMVLGFPVYTDLMNRYPGAPGYSEVLPPCETVVGGVAVGDLFQDGSYEIVAATLAGKVYTWNADGTRLPGFPVSIPRPEPYAFGNGVFATPALGDLDRDGRLDIVAAAFDQRVYAWNPDGILLPGWPVLARDTLPGYNRSAQIVSSPAIGDLEGDGFLEVVLGTNEIYGGDTLAHGRVYAFRYDGTRVPGWPVKPRMLLGDVLPMVAQGVSAAPALADLDGDHKLEVVVGPVGGIRFAQMRIPFMPAELIYNHDGTLYRSLSGYPFGAQTNAWAFLNRTYPVDAPALILGDNASIGDLDLDGYLDVTTGSVGGGILLREATESFMIGTDFYFPYHHLFTAWNARTGRMLSGFPRVMDDWQFFVDPVIADLGGTDAYPEAIQGSGGYLLHAFDANGNEPENWPKFTGGWIAASAAVGDLDGDGLWEVVVNTRDGQLFAWNTSGPVGRDGKSTAQWLKFHHDAWNSGVYGVDAIAPAAVGDLHFRIEPAGPGAAHKANFTWLAVGGDVMRPDGNPVVYEVRASSAPIREHNDWMRATKVMVLQSTLAPGTLVRASTVLPLSVSPMEYFAVRAKDGGGNISPLR